MQNLLHQQVAESIRRDATYKLFNAAANLMFGFASTLKTKYRQLISWDGIATFRQRHPE